MHYVGHCAVELPRLMCIGIEILEEEGGNNPALVSIPDYYHEFLDIFNKRITEGLPLYRPGINYIIKLRDENRLPVSPLYVYNQEELWCEKVIVDEFLVKGWIRPLKLPVMSSTVFVRKIND